MRFVSIPLLALSIILGGCAAQRQLSPRTAFARCSLDESGWTVASSVPTGAKVAASQYGPPPAGYQSYWLTNGKGNYRFCVMRPGAGDECGAALRILPIWYEDGRWNTYGWLDRHECRSDERKAEKRSG